MSRRVPASNALLARVPFLLFGAVVLVALFCSGCCGGCCRALASSGGGTGGGSSTGPGGLSEAPSSGSVSDLVAQRVGPYTLIGTAPVTRLGSGLRDGVVDSIGAAYATPGGARVQQIILAYPSAAAARSHMDIVYSSLLQECGAKRTMRSNVNSRDGSPIGLQVVCDSNPQHVYWNNGRILTFVTAPHPDAINFYHASAY